VKERIHEKENSSMSKRPAIDLSALTSEAAAPMVEASQRSAQVVAAEAVPHRSDAGTRTRSEEKTKTADLQPIAFKVPPAFRRRFRERAATADLKLNELLFEAFDAWEEKKGFRK
jgi:hypothetical protein